MTAEDSVRRFEDHLAGIVQRLDQWLETGQVIRSDLALKLHALREAADPAVNEAEADALARIAENRPYEDAMDADELVALARSGR